MNIEFVEYTGGWPALCCGELKLKIDGKPVTFGSGDSDYPRFWTTGGSCGFNGDYEEEYVFQGPWKILEHRLPKKFRSHAQELIDLFNKNVPEGCCGGCI